jgi:hypothetical protein
MISLPSGKAAQPQFRKTQRTANLTGQIPVGGPNHYLPAGFQKKGPAVAGPETRRSQSDTAVAIPMRFDFGRGECDSKRRGSLR